MVNKSIVDYLKKGKARGFTYARLKQELVKNNFNSAEVDEAINFLKSSKKKVVKKSTTQKTTTPAKKKVVKKVAKTTQAKPKKAVQKQSKDSQTNQIKPIVPKGSAQSQKVSENKKVEKSSDKNIKARKENVSNEAMKKGQGEEKAPPKGVPKWFWWVFVGILVVAGGVVAFLLMQ